MISDKNPLQPDTLNKNLYNLPRQLYILSFLELWDRFSFYGTSAILILFLIHFFHFSDERANDFYGVYSALAFMLPVLGGLIADRILGFIPTIIWGAAGIILGNLLLMVPNHFFTYLGLSISICGIGMFKGNITSLVGTLYPSESPQRNGGYTFFYMAMNIGAVLGPLTYGIIGKEFGWSSCFGLSACLMAIGLVFFIINRKYFPNEIPKEHYKVNFLSFFQLSKSQFIMFLMIGVVTLITGLFFLPSFANIVVAGFCIAVFIGIAIVAFKRNLKERNRILLLILLSLFAVFYFACSLQTGSSLTLFIDRYVTKSFFNLNIPTVMFSALNPFFTIALAPFFIFLWSFIGKYVGNPSAAFKTFLGLFLAAISFFVFSLAAYHFNMKSQHQLLWIVLGNLLLGAGELVIMPSIMSTISILAPKDLLGTLMGMWFLSLALSGYVGSLMAKLMDKVTNSSKIGEAIYFHGFTMIGYVMLGVSTFLLIAMPLLKKMER